MKQVCTVVLVLVLLLVAVILQAQGVVDGIAMDNSSAPIRGAVVRIVGTSMSATSASNGRFRISEVPPGEIHLRAIHPLYADTIDVILEIHGSSNGMLTVRFERRNGFVGPVQSEACTVWGASRDPVHAKIVAKVTELDPTTLLNSTCTSIFEEVARATDVSTNSGGLVTRGGRVNERRIGRDGLATGSQDIFGHNQYPYGGGPAQEDGRYIYPKSQAQNRESIVENPFRAIASHPQSTFAVDVDNASYTLVRSSIESGVRPNPRAVRIEELVNYFQYQDPMSWTSDPLAINVETVESPWNAGHRVCRILLAGSPIQSTRIPPYNLVMLIDVSGSMISSDKLPLVRRSLVKLIDRMRPVDRISIVTFSDSIVIECSGISGARKSHLLSIVSRLVARGFTAGERGLKSAYDVAEENFQLKGNNRVILVTDGDFNVGKSSENELVRLIERERDGGVFLSILGFGSGGYRDGKLEAIADNGNGNYYYIDRLDEAIRVLDTEMTGTLNTVAKDVKVEVSFNPHVVRAYRLIGYENRRLRTEDFDDDLRDAGDVGAGQQVTALYEVIPVGVPTPYALDTTPQTTFTTSIVFPELFTVNDLARIRVRYKDADQDSSAQMEYLVSNRVTTTGDVSASMRLALAVAGWGMLLRGSSYSGTASRKSVLDQLAGLDTASDQVAELSELIRSDIR